ncbi:hypothetical protein ACIBSR_38825 [Streptomyces sp. NPDC049936]|uniref:hypothetical protein n=1 Tax=Streptomyces sp. NPDC049936 TaxID=3365599 RepID=UPI00379FA7C5
MLSTMRARKRHLRLMRAAHRVLQDAMVTTSQDIGRVTPAQVACLAFARHEMRIDDEEAADYLAAALADRGLPTGHRPAPAV